MRLFLQTTALTLALTGILPLWAQTQDRVLADEVAAVVGHSTILLSDIERQAAFVVMSRKERGTLSNQNPKEEAFEMLLMQNVLSQRARIDSLDKEMQPITTIVENEIERMVNNAGGIKNLEREQGKPIYQIRSDISRQVQDMELARMMQSKIRRQTKITYGEVQSYAEKTPSDSMQKVPIQYSFSKIVKIPPQTEERKYAIRERLLEYRKRVIQGEKFSVLARLYSMSGEAPMGGEMGPIEKERLVGPFVSACEELKPGQVSEIVETEYGQHIIELISFKNGMIHCRHILLKPEFTIEESEKVIKELDSLATEIRAGRLDFKAAALRYSDDKDSRENGGKSFNTASYMSTGDMNMASSRYMPDELHPIDYREIRSLGVGQLSNSYESIDSKGNVVQQIIRLDDMVPAHNANIELDYNILESFAIGEKQTREFDKWADKTISDMFIEITPAFADYKFVRKVFDTKKK